MAPAVTISSAKLTKGMLAVKHDQPTMEEVSPQPTLRNEICGMLDKMATSSFHSLETGSEGSSGTVVERGVWQSFILLIQLQHPEVAVDIDVAHRIGRIPFTRTVMDGESIDLLNRMITAWFGGEVEIHAVEHNPQGTSYPDAMTNMFIGVPFYPVTGLRVVVVPVQARAMSLTDRQILTTKTEISKAQGVLALGMSHRLYVKEDWIAWKGQNTGRNPVEVRKRVPSIWSTLFRPY